MFGPQEGDPITLNVESFPRTRTLISFQDHVYFAAVPSNKYVGNGVYASNGVNEIAKKIFPIDGMQQNGVLLREYMTGLFVSADEGLNKLIAVSQAKSFDEWNVWSIEDAVASHVGPLEGSEHVEDWIYTVLGDDFILINGGLTLDYDYDYDFRAHHNASLIWHTDGIDKSEIFLECFPAMFPHHASVFNGSLFFVAQIGDEAN